METQAADAEPRLVAGHPAFDFLNTQGGEPRRPEDEVIHGYDDLVAWSRQAGLLTEAEGRRLSRQARKDPAAATEAFERAKRVRSDLYQLFDAIHDGRRPLPATLAALRRAAAEGLAHADLARATDGYRWSWAGDGDLTRPIWPIVHAAIDLLTAGPLDRVKRCDRCRWWFLDETKNGSRRWCSMADCGTVVKASRYVARRAAARRDGTG